MTVLEVVLAALSEIGASAAPSSVIGTDTISTQVRNFLYAESRFLRNLKIFPQTKRQYSFSLVAARTQYPLPQDFYSSLSGTQWDTTATLPLTGPVSDAVFNFRRYAAISSNVNVAYRIFGPDGNPNTTQGQFQVDPAPTATDTIKFEYITKNLFIPTYWITATAFAAGSYCSASGNIYKTTAGGTTGATIPTHSTGSASDGTVTWVYQAPPYETVIADTDLSLFDDDIMISGIKWRYNQSKGTEVEIDPQTGIPRRHMNLINSAKARWTGSYKVSLAEPAIRNPVPTITDGSWSL